MQLGGRLVKVRKDDPRFEEEDEALMAGTMPRYPHRRPSAATKRAYAVGKIVGESPAAQSFLSPGAQTLAATAAAPVIAKVVPRAVKVIAQRAKAVGGVLASYAAAYVGVSTATLAGLLAAGAASYLGTTYIINNFPTKQRRLDAAADAYRRARTDLARVLGRELNTEELKKLSTEYKATVAAINSYPF